MAITEFMSSYKILQPMLTDGVHFPLRSAAVRPFRHVPTLVSVASLNSPHRESRTTMVRLFPSDDDLLASAMVCSRQTPPPATLGIKFPPAPSPIHSGQFCLSPR